MNDKELKKIIIPLLPCCQPDLVAENIIKAIRAASAVQEEITSKHFTEERKWALNRDVVAFLDILPANGYKIVKERKDV